MQDSLEKIKSVVVRYDTNNVYTQGLGKVKKYNNNN